MPLTVEARDPELDVVELNLLESGVTIDRWLEYSFSSDYLTPSDGFHFTIGGEDIVDEQIDALEIGAEVVLKVNGLVQAAGYIDDVDIHNDKRSGTIVSITGRDTLGYLVDATVDPRFSVPPTATVEEFALKLFESFGVVTLVENSDRNTDQLTGIARGGRVGQILTSKKGKPLKKRIGHQLKPYAQEGCFAFAARVLQRHGLYIQPSFDGSGVVVGTPNFSQAALYRLQRRKGERGFDNNIISGGVRRSGKNQPSAIIASGFGGGGENSHSTIRAAAVNPFVEAPFEKIISDWPSLRFMPLGDEASEIGGPNFVPVAFKSRRARPLYLHDEASRTPEQIENFVRREMSMRMRDAVTANYSIAGHSCNGAVWAVDTIVLVDDEISRLQQPMWVLGRRFSKSRKSGTTTDLSLIQPGSIVI